MSVKRDLASTELASMDEIITFAIATLNTAERTVPLSSLAVTRRPARTTAFANLILKTKPITSSTVRVRMDFTVKLAKRSAQ